MLKQQDVEQIKAKGITEEDVLEQISKFRQGFPTVDLAAPATPGNGILILDEEQTDHLVNLYDEDISQHSVLKFVPASGAATRMFKSVFEWREKLQNGFSVDTLLSDDSNAKLFFKKITDFAFWDDLCDVMQKSKTDAVECLKNKDFLTLMEYLLDDKGLGYGNLPKGLLKFHKYDGFCRTSFEEHFVEGALYGKNAGGVVNLHFTVSPEHMEMFHKHMDEVVKGYENYFNVKYEINYSIQDPSTDTIAVDPGNHPFREPSGELLFRPGGHGALINNLNKVNEDIVFIKNIDNVVPDRLKEPTVKCKKMIGGLLLELQKEVHRLQEVIDDNGFNDRVYEDAVSFACKRLNFDKAFFTKNPGEGKRIMQQMLYSPVRVCGMVKNEGEPGGGPFWVYSKDKTKGLQIIESSQINMDDPKQKKIFNESTHFNPVDIVCGLKSWKGEKYDLEKYIDHDTGFISHKSKDGRPLKALELPGLWNGAMAHWITVFVEVPIETFNPVKTINDLLRKEHSA